MWRHNVVFMNQESCFTFRICAFLLYLNMLEPESWLWLIVRTSEGSNLTVNSVFFLSIGWVEVQIGATVYGEAFCRDGWPPGMAFDETKISFDWDNKLMLNEEWWWWQGWGLVHGFMVYMCSLSVCLCFEIFSFVICHVVFCICSSCLKFEEDHPRPTSSWWNHRQLVHHSDMLICLHDG